MALAHSPAIVASGLVLCVDAGNPNSFGSGVPNSSLSTVEVLVVAGGGAGGAAENNTNGGGGGGGGAGGVVYSATFPVTAGTAYTVTVGSGGLSNSIPLGYGGNGNNSSFGTLTAIGGGGGGGGDLEGGAGLVPALSGGSGGGAGGDVTTEISASGTTGQGTAGGARGGPGNNRAGAGGGGAGQAGTSGARGINNTGRGGPGGNGISYDISGTATFYGGGGGGGACANASSGVQSSAGGLGGGGAGAGDAAATSGTAFTGGGGGGGYGAFGLAGGSGGSGIVIVRYPGGPQATGGAITSANNNTIHTFSSSGTFTTLSSATWRDISGQSNNGVCVATPTFNSANGGYLTFNGTTQYVSPSSQLSGNGSKTITAWFRTTSTSRQGLCGTRELAPGNGWVFCVNRTTPGNLTYFHTAGSTLEVAAGIAINTWYSASATYDLATATATLYLNGVQIGSPQTGFSAIITSAFNGVIGGEDDAGGSRWTGDLAQVTIYNRALTAAEIQQNFNALRVRFGI